jgi:hypothetical protein
MRKPKLLAIAIIQSMIMLSLISSTAAWVDNGTAVCTALGHQNMSIACSDGEGGVFVVWGDSRDGSMEVYVQRLDPNGLASWATNGVNVSRDPAAEYNVQMTKTSGDGVILAWTRGGGTGANVYAQKVSGTGSTYWTTAGAPVCTASLNQDLACLCSDGNGGAIIAWQDLRNGNYDIYAQRLNASGAANWTANGILVCTSTLDQLDPVICSDGAGGAIIAWDDSRGSGDIYAQRVNRDGVVQWAAGGVPVANTTNSQQNPVMCSDGAGGAILAWHDTRADGDGDIYAQRILPGGTGAWLANGTPVCVDPGSQEDPVIAASSDGGAIVGWVDQRDTPLVDIYVQMISASGTVQWSTNGVPASSRRPGSYSLQLCSDGAGGAFLTWVDDDKAADPRIDIYAQRVTSSGSMDWGGNGTCICNADSNQDEPSIAETSNGKAIITWTDARSGMGLDVYAQQVAITTQDDGLLGVIITIVVASIAAAAAVLLVLLYKKGKLPLHKNKRSKSPSS